jgi:predicted SnoaL-like aldol condensation-catalyzing enzyme
VGRNRETVERYMEGFNEGDREKILSCLADDVEWEMPGAFRLSGKSAFREEVRNPAFVGLPVIEVARYVEEGDLVVAEGKVRAERAAGGFLEAVFCDVFTMADGKIRRLVSYLTETRAAASRKEAAAEFLRLVSSGKVREAFLRHAGPGFRHHNPSCPGDAASLEAAMAQSEEILPGKVLEVLRAVEEGDLVAVHSRLTREAGDLEMALVHIFRFEGDRIAEMWDVGQSVPGDAPNGQGMF